MSYDTILAETIKLSLGGESHTIAYLARPMRPGPLGAVVVLHHMPGFDEETREIVRKLADHGSLGLAPHLHYRYDPDDPARAAALARAAGGVPDSVVLESTAAAVEFLHNSPQASGAVAVMGFCSGGRHALLAGCSLELDAVIDCYGSFVLEAPDPSLGLSIAPFPELLTSLRSPVLGIFGADDRHPAPQETAELGRRLAALGCPHELRSYEGAGHAFMSSSRPGYRAEPAQQAWDDVFRFLGSIFDHGSQLASQHGNSNQGASAVTGRRPAGGPVPTT